MKSAGTKKPCHPPRSNKVICANKGILTMSNLTTEVNHHMSSLALSFNDVNFDATTYQNDVWLGSAQIGLALEYANPETAITKLYNRNSDEFTNSMTRLVETKTNGGIQKVRVFSLRGCHLLAMFARTAIAKQFRKWVLDILDREVLSSQIENRQSISPEQQALLHEIVARRSGGERKIFAEMWARHNRHFKIPRYAELLAIHFPEAIHYLETMELKAKAVIEKQVVKALPYPQEVIQVAQQINQEFKSDRYTSWYVNARDGILSVMPLPHGFYPAMDMAEFTKRFDSLLDLLYGSDVLQQGRHFLRERNAK